MRRNRRVILVSALGTAVIAAVLILAVQVNSKYGILSMAAQFQSFRVTVNNESDFDLSILETGVVTGAAAGASTDELRKTLSSGKTIKIRPRLSLSGEGGIYLKYTDPRAPDVLQTIGVCSYTESLSGYSKVTITNNKVTVKENCS
ncbi:hypothetical protein QW71_16595 [Paenibacillus sp. IHB B 3415]|uniref:hypothetical protein n=1 Tax=Paenibacillus sp. IHB B 3415 TaxID=867080 RepID=UPI000575AE3B|nr:hypothetical protein [Paenibacillus sp. IHB B 3415]KHL94721.1 hypothetical protein QW71_16595 [Paenibacillus sp. IHB B 3415]